MAGSKRPISAATRSRVGTLADEAYAHLRDPIVTLRLAPGAPLTEVEVSRRLGMSRTPVRAALLRLQQEGLVIGNDATRPGRVIVAPLTADDMRELFLMVGALDGVAARLAAELPAERRAAIVVQGGLLTGQLRALEATEVSDIRAAQELDLQFHRCYEEAAAGPRLLVKLRALHARRERYVRVYTEALIHTQGVRESLDEHGRILDAIKAGDGDAAEQAARFNYRNAIERYRRIVAVHGERGSWG
ncbi:MAG TPA: GntR family transcriptional regulator [Vicinamibacterales bacterium]|jgi:DNA-binding GntR family transcriptional regulator